MAGNILWTFRDRLRVISSNSKQFLTLHFHTITSLCHLAEIGTKVFCYFESLNDQMTTGICKYVF